MESYYGYVWFRVIEMCDAELWDLHKQIMWHCELKQGHKNNHKATFNWIEVEEVKELA